MRKDDWGLKCMETFEEYLETIDNPDHRMRLSDLFNWITEEFPQLDRKIAWNQPMFTHKGTFIIGFSTAKHHLSVAPEKAGLREFMEDIERTEYKTTKELFQIRWSQPVDYELLRDVISFNIEDKKDYPHFWRK